METIDRPAAIGSMREMGFIVIPQLIGPDVVEEIRENYDQILRKERDLGDDDRMLGGLIRQVILPSKQHPFFRDNAAIRAAKEVAAELLECSEPQSGFNQLLCKEPGNPNVTPWHQDFAYWNMPFTPAGTPIQNSTLQFWIALDEVDEENGCLQFVPRAHHNGILSHYVASGDPNDESRLLATDEADLREVVACPLHPGGSTVHYEGTPHFAGANRTQDRYRRAYIINFHCG